jgi:hypothetical protein
LAHEALGHQTAIVGTHLGNDGHKNTRTFSAFGAIFAV